MCSRDDVMRMHADADSFLSGIRADLSLLFRITTQQHEEAIAS